MSAPHNPFAQGSPPPLPNPYQASPGGPGYGPPKGPGPGLGIASLVCGVLGILLSCCCGLFSTPFSLVAIVLGVIALQKSDSAGRGMAIGGIICGGLAILLVIVSLVIAFANPAFMQQFQQLQNP